MKKVVYLIAITFTTSLFSCQEAKKEASQVEEGLKEAGKDLTNEPAKEVGEGFEEAGEDLTNEPAQQLGEGFEDAGKDIETEAKEIAE